MEKNIHDDRLDDYVKGSFEDYAENPATNMWERIEKELPKEDRKPVWYAWRHFGWPLAAALVILLLVARLVCVEGYYEEKLQKISAQQNRAVQNAVQTPPVMVDPSRTDSSEQGNIGTSQLMDDNKENRNKKSDTNAKNSGQNQLQLPSIPPPAQHKASANTKIETTSPASPVPSSIIGPAAPSKQPDTIGAALIQRPDGKAPSMPPVDSIEATGLAFQKQPGLALLPHWPSSLPISKAAVPTTLLAIPAVPSRKQATGWYAGMFVTPHLTIERPTPAVRPGLRRLFVNQQEKPQASSDFSLRAGKKINSWFALETGLGYQQLNRTASHLARFEYREGQTIQNPGGAESRSFDYDLNTYSGSASVSLRMEVAGNSAPAALERVGALITSQESLQILQVPVLGVARLGEGRTKFLLKAGVLGSYLAKNSFEITAQRIENQKLRIRSQDGYSIQFNRPQRFIWGYQLSAGAEFKLTKNIGLSVAPTLSGDFQRKASQQGKLPGHTALGMNMGAIWWF